MYSGWLGWIYNWSSMVLPAIAFALLLIVPHRREQRLRREHEREELQREYLAALEARQRMREIVARSTGLPFRDASPHHPEDYGDWIVLGDPHFQGGHICTASCLHFPVKRPPTPVYEPCEQHSERPRRVIRWAFPRGVPDEAGFKARGLIVRHRSGV